MAKIIKFPSKQLAIDQATHWIPKEVDPSCEGHITDGKAYKIHYHKMRDEFYILDDYGSNTVWFMTCPGEYVKMN